MVTLLTADLHDFGQDGFVEVVLQGGSAEVSLVNILLLILKHDTQLNGNFSHSTVTFVTVWCDRTHHEKGSSVVVLLQELVFALGRLVGDDLATVAQLCPPLLLRQVVESVDLGLLPLHAEDRQHCQHVGHPRQHNV